MNARWGMLLFVCLLVGAGLSAAPLFAQMPPALSVSGESVVVRFHAEGAQIYECKLDPANKLVWHYREPVAALMVDGVTVGFHLAGPVWQHVDGSSVRAKMVTAAPGATFNDIPWLKLEVIEQHGKGVLSRVTAIQRINTKGGMIQGECPAASAIRSIPYSADYVFFGRRG